MTTTFFISDLHLGHKRIIEFSKESRESSSIEAHNQWIITQWNSVVGKRDTVYCLGDIAFSRDGLQLCNELNGIKKAILGNHDGFSIEDYQSVGFKILPSIYKYKQWWLTHAPIHPQELRGKGNIHGHVHSNSIDDIRYMNVCVENVQKPVSLDEVRGYFHGAVERGMVG